MQKRIWPTLLLHKRLQIPLCQRRQHTEDANEVTFAGTVGTNQHVDWAELEFLQVRNGLVTSQCDGLEFHLIESKYLAKLE